MISGANEEELEMASVRADIMIALNEKYGNYNLLDKLDKYQENEKQQLIKFLEDKIKECQYKKSTFSEELCYWTGREKSYQEVLDFVKGDKDE